MPRKYFALLIFICLAFVSRTQTESKRNYGARILYMMQLMQMELKFIENLMSYTYLLQEKIDRMRSMLHVMELEHIKFDKDHELYMSNPLNGFALLRRTHLEWPFLHTYMSQSLETDIIDRAQLERMQIEKYFNDTMDNLLFVQQVYKLKVDDFVNKVFYGKKNHARLTEFDCYQFGQHLKNLHSVKEAEIWFRTALKKCAKFNEKFSKVYDFSRATIYNQLALLLIYTENYVGASMFLKTGLKFEPDSMELLSTKNLFAWYLNNRKGCRGQMQPKTRHHCYYNSTASAFLKLAPIKTEVLSLAPKITLYYDVLYDTEIEELKRLAMPILYRYIDGPHKYTQKIAKLRNQTKILTRINQRMEDMTGLYIDQFDTLQVTNYGMGGDFYNHVDYYEPEYEPSFIKESGNRYAGVLFYMQDVKRGGATCFPIADIAVQPRKGNAIVWHHMTDSGQTDKNSLHAGCPVLYGSKWMAIKMLYERDQVFKRPCYQK